MCSLTVLHLTGLLILAVVGGAIGGFYFFKANPPASLEEKLLEKIKLKKAQAPTNSTPGK